MNLLLPKELAKILNVKAEKIIDFCKKGMPHLQLGNECRFIEEEATPWYEKNFPSQEKLEATFVDEKGRTLADYVTFEAIIDVLRVSKEKIYRLSRAGMPYQQVGKKRFFHIEDIVNYFRKGDTISKKEKADSLTIELRFQEVKKDGCYFHVITNGITERMKNKNPNPICAAVHIMNDFIQFSKKPDTLRLRKIANIEQYQSAFLEKDLTFRKTFQSWFQHIKKKTLLVTEDDFSFLFSPSQEEKESSKKHPEVLFVVDGSHDDINKKGGVGVVQKIGETTSGYSFDIPSVNSQFSEYMAICRALELIQQNGYEKATIATDHLAFTQTINSEGHLQKTTWEKKNNVENLMNRFRNLCMQLKNKVTFIYYKKIENIKSLYDNAHVLSRVYEDTIIKNENLMKINVSLCEKEKVDTKEVLPQAMMDIDQIEIEFSGAHSNYNLFDVIINGVKKNKQVKILGYNPIRTAIILANSYAQNFKRKTMINLKNISTFIKEFKELSSYEKQGTFNLVEKIKKKAILEIDNLDLYNLEESLQIKETA